MRSRFLLHTFPDIHIYISIYACRVALASAIFVLNVWFTIVRQTLYACICWKLLRVWRAFQIVVLNAWFVMVFWKITKSIFYYTRGNMVVDGWAKIFVNYCGGFVLHYILVQFNAL